MLVLFLLGYDLGILVALLIAEIVKRRKEKKWEENIKI